MTAAYGGIRVIVLQGDLSGAAARELDRALGAVLNSESDAVVVDLRRTTFMNQTSLRLLVKAWRRATQRDIGFMLVRPNLKVWGLFALSGLDVQLPSCSSLNDAIQVFERPASEVATAPRAAHRSGRSCEAVIRRSSETVFRYLIQLEHSAEWRPEDFSAVTKETPGPTEAGTRYVYITRRTGTRGEWIVDEVIRPHWLRCTSPPTKIPLLGRVWGSEEYLLLAEGEQTRLSVTLNVHFSGPLRVAAPLLSASMGRRLEEQLERLKERVEA